MPLINRAIVFVVACFLPACLALTASAAERKQPASLTVLNYITGWQLDAIGYHPAVFMLVENTSGKDLTGTLIRLQGRFTDLQTAGVTIGRTELRRDLKAHQQFPVSIASSAAFELPYQVDMWPRIEAKVLCRLGNKDDEGTETLLISKIDETARSEDAAFEHLNEATSFAPKTSTAGYSSSKAASAAEKPSSPRAQKAADSHPEFLNEGSLPGLGDNFYKFEQRFGLPKEFDATHSEWTWARYEDGASGSDIIAGSHDRRGNAAVVIVSIPKASGLDVMRLAAAARAFSGKLHGQALSAAGKSVRYLPCGRLELIASQAVGYHVLCMQGQASSESRLILILSRKTQDAEQLLATQAPKVALLRAVNFLAASPSAASTSLK